MKTILALMLTAAFAMPVLAADEAPKTKQVCKDVVGKDGKAVKNKDGSVKQSCKTIKIHKKYEGTPVPEKAPKK
jgi:azurin